jgi:hypothetical protein
VVVVVVVIVNFFCRGCVVVSGPACAMFGVLCVCVCVCAQICTSAWRYHVEDQVKGDEEGEVKPNKKKNRIVEYGTEFLSKDLVVAVMQHERVEIAKVCCALCVLLSLRRLFGHIGLLLPGVSCRALVASPCCIVACRAVSCRA